MQLFKSWKLKAEKREGQKLETKIKISTFQKKLETKGVNFSKNQKLESWKARNWRRAFQLFGYANKSSNVNRRIF